MALNFLHYDDTYTDSCTTIIGVKTDRNYAYKTALREEYRHNMELLNGLKNDERFVAYRDFDIGAEWVQQKIKSYTSMYEKLETFDPDKDHETWIEVRNELMGEVYTPGSDQTIPGYEATVREFFVDK